MLSVRCVGSLAVVDYSTFFDNGGNGKEKEI